MYALAAIAISLAVLVVLLRLKVALGVSMVAAACALAVLLGVWPGEMWSALAQEWHSEPLRRTTGYLFVSLTALVLLVNVLGAAMVQTGISARLAPAMQGLFRSRRFALALIPLMMGLLPTPGGIMLSAPMVRDAGDAIGVSRGRAAAINFVFRHQWEPVWPLFPVLPLVQSLVGVSALAVCAHHAVLTAAGIGSAVVCLLAFGIPPRSAGGQVAKGVLGGHAKDFLHAFWPIVFTGLLYVGFDIPPAVGVFGGIVGVLLLHKVSLAGWGRVFRAGCDGDLVLLIVGALLFKVNLEAGGAVGSVVGFFESVHLPGYVVLFLLPALVGFSTGVMVATVAITYPFLLSYMGTGAEAQMGLEAWAFSGALFGLWLTPVHLCVSLSASYFETSLWRVILRILPVAAAVAAAGALIAVFVR